MTFEEAKKVHTGMVLRDLSNGEAFAVLCNCPHSEPRRHTQRYVVANPDKFEMVHTPTDNLQLEKGK